MTGMIRLALLATAAVWPLAPAFAQSAPAAGTAGSGLADLSQTFWTDWTSVKTSPQVAALAGKVGYAEEKAARVKAAASARNQAIVPIAIHQPKDAAKFLEAVGRAAAGPATDGALATVAAMRIAPQTRKAAIAFVPKESRKRVETWNATLATGIRGLPGIYLGSGSQSASGASLSAPAGYVPVAGSSFGCPVQ